MRQLFIIKDAIIVPVEDGPPVIVMEFLGGDRWGCHPETPVHAAGREDGCVMPAGELCKDMRIWLDVEALVADGTFNRHK